MAVPELTQQTALNECGSRQEGTVTDGSMHGVLSDEH